MSGSLWEPAADIYRTPGGWKIKFDLAGVKPEDIEILISGDRLTIRGVRRDSIIDHGWSYYQMEITYSRFERVLALPCDLERARISCECRDGWLMLHIDEAFEKR
jgi:HSP20 family protein